MTLLELLLDDLLVMTLLEVVLLGARLVITLLEMLLGALLEILLLGARFVIILVELLLGALLVMALLGLLLLLGAGLVILLLELRLDETLLERLDEFDLGALGAGAGLDTCRLCRLELFDLLLERDLAAITGS